MEKLHCGEPYAAERVAMHLDRLVERSVRRVYYAIYRITEVHGVTATDVGWVLGVHRDRAIPNVPIEPSTLRWTRAKGLVELQKAIDAGQVGRVIERSGRRRVRLGNEPEASFKFGMNWRALHDALTLDGRASLYYVAQYAGCRRQKLARLAQLGAEPMLDVGERVLLLREMIESGALQGWGERSDARVAPETRRRERGRKVRMLGEDGEPPVEAISPRVNEAFSFPEGDGERARGN